MYKPKTNQFTNEQNSSGVQNFYMETSNAPNKKTTIVMSDPQKEVPRQATNIKTQNTQKTNYALEMNGVVYRSSTNNQGNVNGL